MLAGYETGNEEKMHDKLDCYHGNCSRTSSVHIVALSLEVKKMVHSRTGGKPALVTPSDLGYGMSRMYQVFAESDQHISDIQVLDHSKTQNTT
jgi:hypothetical protein